MHIQTLDHNLQYKKDLEDIMRTWRLLSSSIMARLLSACEYMDMK